MAKFVRLQTRKRQASPSAKRSFVDVNQILTNIVLALKNGKGVILVRGFISDQKASKWDCASLFPCTPVAVRANPFVKVDISGIFACSFFHP